MNFDQQRKQVQNLGDLLLDAADRHDWTAVADHHSELQQLVVTLFQSPDLPRDARPAQLLREVQTLSEDLSRRASHARRKCGEHLTQLQLQRRGVRLYQDTQRC